MGIALELAVELAQYLLEEIRPNDGVQASPHPGDELGEGLDDPTVRTERITAVSCDILQMLFLQEVAGELITIR